MRKNSYIIEISWDWRFFVGLMDTDKLEEETEKDINLPIDEHEEIVSEGGKKVLRRGVYLLPNLFKISFFEIDL